MIDEYEFIVLSPFHLSDQNKRLDNILKLKNNLNYTVSAFKTYISAGKTLANAMGNIANTFLECGSFSKDPTIANISSCIKYFKSNLESHFSQVQDTIISPLQKFVDEDIYNCEKAYKESSNKKSEYFGVLDKIMTAKKVDNSILQQLQNSKKEAAVANFEFGRALELVERKHSYELTAVLLMFLNILRVSYKDCIFNYETSKDEFTALQIAIPSYLHDMNSYEAKTRKIRQTIENLVEVNQEGSLNRCGYLWKRGNGFGKVWHIRYVTVINQQFKFYKVRGDIIEDRGTIDLLTASVKKDVESGRPNCLRITDPKFSWVFQCTDSAEADRWIATIKENVSYSLDHHDDGKKPSETRQEATCADCGGQCPTWCCINWGTSICIHCSGIHRSLGVNVSKVRSLTLDKLDPDLTALMNNIGNDKANSVLLSGSKPAEDMPRDELIKAKYIDLAFMEKCNDDIYEMIEKRDFAGVMKCVFSGQLKSPSNRISYYDHVMKTHGHADGNASQYNTIHPLHVAAASGDVQIMLLIALNTDNLNVFDIGEWTPLAYAVYHKKTPVVNALMKLGADPGKHGKTGNPYHIAIINNDRELAALFLPFWTGDTTPTKLVPPVNLIS